MFVCLVYLYDFAYSGAVRAMDTFIIASAMIGNGTPGCVSTD